MRTRALRVTVAEHARPSELGEPQEDSHVHEPGYAPDSGSSFIGVGGRDSGPIHAKRVREANE